MIYLDSGATSFYKPRSVYEAVQKAMHTCANPGRGGHRWAANAENVVYDCREQVGKLFHCEPESVVFTANCTHALNIAIHSLVKPGAAVAVSGFEHNAVIRPLYAKGANIHVAGRKLFDRLDTLEEFEKVLKKGVDAAIFTHVSNVFGYSLPVKEMAALCRHYGVPFVIDAAQSAGYLPIDFESLGAAFIAMPGHKGLLGPQGTGVLLCNSDCTPILYGGTGSASRELTMPDALPDRLEAGTVNVPGIAGLGAGISYIQKIGLNNIKDATHRQMIRCIGGLQKIGLHPIAGADQLGTVSFVPPRDTEEVATELAQKGIAVRAGLHCAPLAHESAGTLDTGTVRVSFCHNITSAQTDAFIKSVANIVK